VREAYPIEWPASITGFFDVAMLAHTGSSFIQPSTRIGAIATLLTAKVM